MQTKKMFELKKGEIFFTECVEMEFVSLNEHHTAEAKTLDGEIKKFYAGKEVNRAEDIPKKTLWKVESYDEKESGLEKAFWTKIGHAVKNLDGTWTVNMISGKFDGDITVRESK